MQLYQVGTEFSTDWIPFCHPTNSGKTARA